MSARSIQGALAAAVRHHPDDDHSDLRRDLAAEQLAEYVRRIVDNAPPLSREQKNRIADLLSKGGDAA